MEARHLAAVLGAMALVAGCLVSVNDPKPRKCETSEDCPKGYYWCAPSGVDETRVCEVIYPPPFLLAALDGGDGGGARDGGGGPPTFYCSNVKPILDARCLFNCHSTENAGSLGTNLRLDLWEDDAGVPGVKSSVTKIRLRMSDSPGNPMPPSTYAVQPTQAERDLVSGWVSSGAPLSFDTLPCSPTNMDSGVSP